MKKDLEQEVRRREIALEQERQEKALKRESIRQMAMRGRQTVDGCKIQKIEMTKAELKAKTEEEKRLIYKFEKEA